MMNLKLSFFLFFFRVYSIIKFAESFVDSTVFEDVNNREIAFPEGLSSCRGTTVKGISRIQCAAACYDSTALLWRTVWFTNVDGDCYCFVFNGTAKENLGSCTLCYRDSPSSVIFELDAVMASIIYAIPSKLCKQVLRMLRLLLCNSNQRLFENAVGVCKREHSEILIINLAM